MICLFCKDECDVVTVDDGFFYEYGSERGWHSEEGEVSNCCGEPVVGGKKYLDKATTHVARKDHLSKSGRVVVEKGQTYTYHIQKGYVIEDGVRKGFIEISKRVVL